MSWRISGGMTISLIFCRRWWRDCSFDHPAAWWISGVIRAEREHCCDDLAAAAIGPSGAYEYALALTALEASRLETVLNRRWCRGHGREPYETHSSYVVSAAGSRSNGRWAVTPALVTVALAVAVAWQASAVPQQQQQQETAYVKWVNEDVVYIIEPREREAYLRLQTDQEREHFIEQFWQRRDPTPGTAKNEFREEHYRRIGFAMERFRSANHVGWKTDRGRIYIRYGPPDEMESHPAGRGGGPPSEQWLYKTIEGIGERVIVEFEDVNRDGEYPQTRDPNSRN